jgi:hypothetical protein
LVTFSTMVVSGNGVNGSTFGEAGRAASSPIACTRASSLTVSPRCPGAWRPLSSATSWSRERAPVPSVRMMSSAVSSSAKIAALGTR